MDANLGAGDTGNAEGPFHGANLRRIKGHSSEVIRGAPSISSRKGGRSRRLCYVEICEDRGKVS